MPALDACHEQIVHALEKEDWSVDDRPFVVIVHPRRPLFIDLHARHESQAIIVVEVKCFPESRSQLVELYTAIGQYLIYRNVLRDKDIAAPLYLAVPNTVYHDLIKSLALAVIEELKFKLIIVDLADEAIEEWVE